ncbi:MAG TPA: FAD-binding and (Fe-S)-binding domain-containing protein [Ktedonobacteraceae bacterium]
MRQRLPMLHKSGASSIAPPTADTQALVHDLRASIRGEVRFDRGSRALYATDGSNYRQVPIGVVLPHSIEDVIQTVALCKRHAVPLLPRGGGTGLAGQTCNTAVIIDMSRHMRAILELDAEQRRARVQPGVVLDVLRNAAEKDHLTFGPDPSTHAQCTLGGMIGNNSCGTHSVMAGKTSENVESLDILTYDGLRLRVGATSDEELAQIMREGGRRGAIYARLKTLRDIYGDLVRARFPNIERRVSGYNLDQLLPENGFHVARALVGSEGTCVTVLEATVRLVASPRFRALLVLGFPDAYIAADYTPEIMTYRPIALEGFDYALIENMRKKKLHLDEAALLPEGGGWLLVEFGADTPQECQEQARQLMEQMRRQVHPPTMKLFDQPREAAKIWMVRESGLGATAIVPGEHHHWEGWEDAAVPPERLGAYLRNYSQLVKSYGYTTALYGHFGQGCVHNRIDFDLASSEGISKFRSFMEEAADMVVGFGGSISGEHGDGQARGELLPKMFGPELMQAFREFKAIWDPQGKMNPGKLIDAYPFDEHLRLGAAYNPAQPMTHFSFPDDEGSFAAATLRCVGVGKCRRVEGGTMCPSFMVTHDEEHSTRGRAHLLFEMLQGQVLTDGWRNEHVKEALDLCLACKGCKSDCPVNVDMATYKAEFLAHYYEGKLRPMSAYTMGLIFWWARLASHAPLLANILTRAPLLSTLAKAMIGVAPQRQLPTFASRTFKEWLRRRGPRNVGAPRVILWPDTFNNYLHPAPLQAAVEVLEAAGYQVSVPQQTLCCGRPLYDFGMLDTAKRLLRQILDALEPEINAGVPIVGLEPSCVAVFRDELTNLFPHDERARRLKKQTFIFSEFLEKQATHFQLPQLQSKAVVHMHCHHKAILRTGPEEAVLKKLGLDYQLLDSGCCGMAGSFGFEKEHYEVSIASGERVLLPAVREADRNTLVITDGFSCREQIAQTTERRALHLAEVIQLALHQDAPGAQASDAAAELQHSERISALPLKTGMVLVGGIGLLCLSALLLMRGKKKRGHIRS